MKSTGVNTSLSFSISFLLGTYLSSDSFAIAQWTLDYYKRKNNAFKVSSKDSENWQLKDKQWSGHWVGNWMTFFSLPRATSVLGIQIFIPYLWCRKQGSHDVSEQIMGPYKAPMMYLSKSVHPCRMPGTSLLHERSSSTHLSLNSLNPPHLYFRAFHLAMTYKQFCNRSSV